MEALVSDLGAMSSHGEMVKPFTQVQLVLGHSAPPTVAAQMTVHQEGGEG